jgi:hypothetical protein
MLPIEIRSGMTIISDFFKNIIDWQDITIRRKHKLISYMQEKKIKNENMLAFLAGAM